MVPAVTLTLFQITQHWSIRLALTRIPQFGLTGNLNGMKITFSLISDLPTGDRR